MNYNAVDGDVGDISVAGLSERHEWSPEFLIWISDEARTADELHTLGCLDVPL